MATLKIKKWGNSLALRLPANLATSLALVEDSAVNVSLTKGQILVKPAPKSDNKLSQLIAQIRKDNLPQVMDWGRVRGKELW